jgi:hypothetical protein
MLYILLVRVLLTHSKELSNFHYVWKREVSLPHAHLFNF